MKEVFYTELCFTVRNVAFAFAQKEWMMYAILAIYCLGGIVLIAGLQSVISSKVSPKEQGDLQGALTSVISITSIIGPLIDDSDFLFFHSSRC